MHTKFGHTKPEGVETLTPPLRGVLLTQITLGLKVQPDGVQGAIEERTGILMLIKPD